MWYFSFGESGNCKFFWLGDWFSCGWWFGSGVVYGGRFVVGDFFGCVLWFVERLVDVKYVWMVWIDGSVFVYGSGDCGCGFVGFEFFGFCSVNCGSGFWFCCCFDFSGVDDGDFFDLY